MTQGLRAVDANGHSSDAAGGQRDGPRLHVRDAEAAAHDHVRGGQGPHPDVPQLTRPAIEHCGPAHVRHGLRGDGADLHVARRGPESKADDVHGPHSARTLFLFFFVRAAAAARRIAPVPAFAPFARRPSSRRRRPPPVAPPGPFGSSIRPGPVIFVGSSRSAVSLSVSRRLSVPGPE